MGEFELIEAIEGLLPGPPAGELWLGDDAAAVAVPAGPGWLLLAADTVVAGVHADLRLTSLGDLGWKAVAASVSDIAAMGGDPHRCLVTIAAPEGCDIPALYEGVAAAAAELGCPVVGGDLSRAPELVVTVAVTGWCDGTPVPRSGAAPGDVIWCCGQLGAAAAGLRLLRSGLAFAGGPASGSAGAWTGASGSAGGGAGVSGSAGAWTGGSGSAGAWTGGSGSAGGGAGVSGSAEGRTGAAAAVRAHARPIPRLAEGAAARAAGATAMIDVSDGLSADLDHVATRSGVGIRLDDLPVHSEATLEEALGGGEDFALVFCAPPSAPVESAFHGLDTPVRIGRCTDDPAERTLRGEPLARIGWEHRW